MKIIGIIPARYESRRFPGKVLADLLGKPMIQWVYEQAKKADILEDVLIATDTEKISAVVKNFGGKVVMTSQQAKSGTERVAEVAGVISGDIFVNIQADEPLISPSLITEVAKELGSHKEVNMATAVRRISNPAELGNPNIVKVVLDTDGFALYFSRQAIPYVGYQLADEISGFPFYKHIGIYAYRREFLLDFPRMKQGLLERVENLEQLRALENGYRIKVVVTEYDSIGVDTEEDLNTVKEILKKRRTYAHK